MVHSAKKLSKRGSKTVFVQLQSFLLRSFCWRFQPSIRVSPTSCSSVFLHLSQFAWHLQVYIVLLIRVKQDKLLISQYRIKIIFSKKINSISWQCLYKILSHQLKLKDWLWHLLAQQCWGWRTVSDHLVGACFVPKLLLLLLLLLMLWIYLLFCI